MTSQPALALRSFGVAFGPQVVLADVTLDLPKTGLTNLVGPAGSGKSTLLRTLAGLNDAHPALATWGEAVFDGQALRPATGSTPERRTGIAFVMQHARFFLDTVRENLVSALPNRAALDPATQTLLVRRHLERNGLSALASRLDADVASLTKPLQRRLAIVRALVSEPKILFADEPTSGLEDDEAVELLVLLRVHARVRSILIVTHHQRFARVAGGTTILLAGGRVQEVAPTLEFFETPRSETARTFVRTGGCDVVSPDATPEVLRPSATPPPSLPVMARQLESTSASPRGFFWLHASRLGGLPRPGIVRTVEHDLDGLRRLGVTVLVTLEETLTVEPGELENRGIASIHFPVVDMSVPALEDVDALCARIERLVRGGDVVAVHCLAGLGRTGTILACQLVFEGESARGAIDRVRELQPRCIQSQAQVDFLSSYEAFRREASHRDLVTESSTTEHRTERR